MPSIAQHIRAVVLPDDIERDVFVVDGRITFAEQRDSETILAGGYLIPGLADVHAHLGINSPAESGSPEEIARASARAHLEAGILTIREPGGPNRASMGIGPHEGLPRTFTAGRFLAPPGRYFPGLAREVHEAELPEAAEEEAHSSGSWVKVIADFREPGGTLAANYSADALGEAVRRAHRLGARVATHVMSEAGMTVAIEAGVDSIEHGQGITEDHIRSMKRTGITFVPTMTILSQLRGLIPTMELTSQQTKKSLADVEAHPSMVRLASQTGVLVLAGTDAGMGPHGQVRGEVVHLINAGVDSNAALAAASWRARSYLGLPGIEEGAPADLVAYPDDPRSVSDVLSRPSLRMLDGRLLEGTTTA